VSWFVLLLRNTMKRVKTPAWPTKKANTAWLAFMTALIPEIEMGADDRHVRLLGEILKRRSGRLQPPRCPILRGITEACQ
jgi:hypothetical protein